MKRHLLAIWMLNIFKTDCCKEIFPDLTVDE